MFCTICGKELEVGARFCTHCGSPVEVAENNIQTTQVLQPKSEDVAGTALDDVQITQVVQPENEEAADATKEVIQTTQVLQPTESIQPDEVDFVTPDVVVRQESTAVLDVTNAQDPTIVQETAVVQDPADAQESATAVQQAAEKQGSKKTAVLIAIIVILAALLAALLAFTMCSSRQAASPSSQDVPESSEQTPSTSSSAASTSTAADASSSQTNEPEETEETLSPEDAAIKSLDGWWAGWYHRPGYYAAYGNIHDKVIDWYFYNPDKDAVEYSNTVDIVKADQFDENGAKGWRFFPSTATNENFAYYQAEGDEDNLPIYKTAFGYGNIDTEHDNTDAVERFGITRITNAAALDEDGIHSQKGFEQAQALAKERGVDTNSTSSASSSAASLPSATAGFDQAKAEADARAAAEAAGKTILTGTIEIVDDATRQVEVGYPNMNPTDRYNPTHVILLFDNKVTVEGKNPDGATNKEHPYITRDIQSLRLASNSDSSYGYQYNDSILDPWREYDGKEVTVACSSFGFATDTSAVLYNASAVDVEVIAPLTEEMVKQREKAAEAENSPDAYVLADSATKVYSRSELEALDNHTLFLARNEIYARHGRGFKNQELRDYFAGKAWYKETVLPESFNDNVLNETEKANANLMLEIEKSRNSPYLG